MLDAAICYFPDFYRTMKVFDINWRNVHGGEKWFISKLEDALMNRFDQGHIVGNFYDDHNFPIDTD